MRVLMSALMLLVGSASAQAGISADYVESRTCSVYTGACHANGEAVTAGREAMLAWSIRSGAEGGVDLAGLRAVAVVSGTANLGLADSAEGRTSILYIDDRANPAQRVAIEQAIHSRYAKQLGHVAAMKSAPITFEQKGLEYAVRIPGVACLKTTRYACSHCVMPHQVWYGPLVPLTDGLVAKADVCEFKGTPELPITWSRNDENSGYAGIAAL